MNGAFIKRSTTTPVSNTASESSIDKTYYTFQICYTFTDANNDGIGSSGSGGSGSSGRGIEQERTVQLRTLSVDDMIKWMNTFVITADLSYDDKNGGWLKTTKINRPSQIQRVLKNGLSSSGDGITKSPQRKQG